MNSDEFSDENEFDENDDIPDEIDFLEQKD